MTELEKQLMKNNDALLSQVKTLSKQNELFQKQNEAQTNELRLLREQVEYLTKKLFGRSSEKSVDLDGQLDLFQDDTTFTMAETK